MKQPFGFLISDDNLMASCQQNDRKAQEILYKRYFDRIFLYIKRYIKDDAMVCSIVNDTFLSVYKAAVSGYNERGNLEGWIKRIAFNKMYDHFRKEKQVIKFLELEESINKQYETAIGSDFDLNFLLNMMGKLPEKQKHVFRKYVMEGYSHREIAEQLQLSEGTSKWLLSESRKNLKNWLSFIDSEYKYGQ